MSSRIGTLQPARTGRPFWLPAALTLLVVATFSVALVSIGVDEGREDAETGTAETTLANTPIELRGGAAVAPIGGTFAATPEEQLSGGRHIVTRFGSGPDEQLSGGRHIVLTPVIAVSGTFANTPTELGGGMSLSAPHRPIFVNDRVCGQCR